jgi:hypothetical protein
MLVIERSGDDSEPTVGVCHVRFRSHRHRALPVLVAFGHGASRAAAWERLIPFLEFPPDIRKILYITNSSESFNYRLRKII